MKIEVLYKDNRFEEFDSSAQTCAEPYHRKGVNVLTDWNLYLDALEENGVILVQHWYDGNPEAKHGTVPLGGVDVPVASRQIGCALLLVSPEELDELVWLKKDDEKILWREGDDLINGERFFAMEQLCYSDATTTSINKRAVAVFDYLKNVHPDAENDEIAARIGYTVAAIEHVHRAEKVQSAGYDDDVSDE